jgi:hypothetical protein
LITGFKAVNFPNSKGAIDHETKQKKPINIDESFHTYRAFGSDSYHSDTCQYAASGVESGKGKGQKYKLHE